MKRIFETRAELDAALALEVGEPGAFRFTEDERKKAGFRCSVCKAAVPFQPGCSAGYAIEQGTDALFCYPCSNAKEVEELKASPGPFYAYVSSNGKHVTTWPGGVLGNIHNYGESRSGWNRGTIARFHVHDVHGQWWSGRGAGHGVCCTLRRLKHVPTYARNWGK